MVEVNVSRTIPVSAAKAWALLEDFGDINWAPGIDKIDVIGSGIGMIRRLHIQGMAPIDEQLTARDAEAMSFAYIIPVGLPMPLTNYGANAKVTAVDDNSCRVDWHGEADPDGISENDAIGMLQGTYESLLQWVDDELTKI